jgi:hypothetical protein
VETGLHLFSLTYMLVSCSVLGPYFDADKINCVSTYNFSSNILKLLL